MINFIKYLILYAPPVAVSTYLLTAVFYGDFKWILGNVTGEYLSGFIYFFLVSAALMWIAHYLKELRE